MMVIIRRVIFAATLLAFLVIVFGAFVRLSNAGLGCPDWPGCYGHPLAPHTETLQQRASSLFPGHLIEVRKAWIEMIHRYLAGFLGILIVIIAIMSWKKRIREVISPVLPTTLIALVIFQGLLGMWTVTLLLKPVIVTLHLLFGMITASVLLILYLRHREEKIRVNLATSSSRKHLSANEDVMRDPEVDINETKQLDLGSHSHILPIRSFGQDEKNIATSARWLTHIGLLLLILQIALGGWVSTNYAALACMDFPTCHGSFWPAMSFSEGFHLIRELGETADGHLLSNMALNAIHWLHRLGALIIFMYVWMIAAFWVRRQGYRDIAITLAILLLTQIILGVANVILRLPLVIAVAHNAGAASLLATMVVLNYRIFQQSR